MRTKLFKLDAVLSFRDGNKFFDYKFLMVCRDALCLSASQAVYPDVSAISGSK
jgi:hypothetical protein